MFSLIRDGSRQFLGICQFGAPQHSGKAILISRLRKLHRKGRSTRNGPESGKLVAICKAAVGHFCGGSLDGQLRIRPEKQELEGVADSR